MACLTLSNGAFDLRTFVTTNANAGQVTITRTAAPEKIVVEHSAFTNDFVLNGGPNTVFSSILFGSGAKQYVAILSIDTSTNTRKVIIVDFTQGGSTPASQVIHTQSAVSNATDTPELFTSPVSQDVIFVYSATGTSNEIKGLAFHRSDTGDVLFAGPGTISQLTNVPSAEVTASQLIMHHPNQFGPADSAFPRPAGQCTITNPANFGEVVIGASNPALGTSTKTAKIKNDGNNCLTITAIGNVAPFTVQAAALAQLPKTLEPGESFDVEIDFAPTALGNNIQQTLPVTRNPANGANQIQCKGSARAAVAKIATSTNTLAFGTIPLPGNATQPFTVTNNGDLDLTITITGPPGGSDFGWVPIPGPGLALPLGATTPPRQVTFTPSADGASAPVAITVTPSLGGASAVRTIDCTGAGCIPDAKISVPAISPLDFGTIERGFRTVRLIEIINTGDDTLTFTASITPGGTPAQAANFGLVLPENDITDAPPSRPYTVLPTVRCGPGPTGNNVQVVAVGFHADGANGAYSANLVISAHNASNAPPATSWTFPLTAAVIDPVPIDIALVIDHSGSMVSSLGTRNKMEAALTGAKLLVNMLRDNAPDRCATIGFSTAPAVAQPIVPAGANRAALLASLGPPTFVPNGWTNIAGGAILGAQELGTAHPANPPQLRKAMVVLTDGIENRCFQEGGLGPWLSITGRDTDMAQPNGTLQTTDPWTPPANAKVYAIGLGAPADIDSAALAQLATATGASYQGAGDLTGKSWFLLEKYFTQIFMETAGLQQIIDPFYTINPGDHHVHEFDVLPGDVSCMVVTYDTPDQRLPILIESPAGEQFSGTSLPPGYGIRFRATATARFVEIHYPAKEPDRYVGRWRVMISHDGYACSGMPPGKDIRGGFLPEKCRKVGMPIDYGIAIGVGSNLRLQPWVDPNTTFVGDSFRLDAVLMEAGLPVTGAQVRVEITGPTGTHWTLKLRDNGASEDGAADDGDYGGRFAQSTAAGNYDLVFVAEGKRTRLVNGAPTDIPFRREAHRSKPVYDKRNPPGEPHGKEDCCKQILRWLQGRKPTREEAAEALGETPKDAPRQKSG